MDIGFPELIIILIIVMLLFGSSKLPQLGHALGKSIGMFKKGLNEPAGEPVRAPDALADRSAANAAGGYTIPQH